MGKRKIYTLSTPSQIRSFGATEIGEAVNLLPENNELRKRNGWRVLRSFRGEELEALEINGIYEYKGEKGAHLIVRAGNRLYRCDYDLKGAQLIYRVPMGGRALAHTYAGLLWLGGTQEGLMCYDGESVKRVQDACTLYAPTTAVGIGDEQSSLVFTPHESPNLLTKQRINAMRGEKHEGEEYRFLMDSSALYGAPVSVKTEFRVKKNREQEQGPRTTEYVGKRNGEIFGGIVTACFKTESLQENGEIPLVGFYDERGNEVTVEGGSFTCRIDGGRWLVFTFNAIAHEVRDNIWVEFSASDSLPVLSAELFTTVEDKDGGAMLFTCGANRVYSLYERDGLFYVPKNQTRDIGQGTEKITALINLSEGNVGVYKERSFYSVCLGSDGLLDSRVLGGSDFYGCISPFAIGKLGYEVVSFCEGGVFSLDRAEGNEAVADRLCLQSGAIQRELSTYTQNEKENACVTAFEGRYYLFIGSRTYVADISDAKGKQGYEWWRLDSCPCRFAAAIGTRLYMGRDSGDIAIFDEGYTDRDGIILTQSGNEFALYADGEHTTVVVDKRTRVSSGDRVCLPEHYAYLGQCTYGCSTNEISVPENVFFSPNGYGAIFEGMEVLLLEENGYEVYRGEIRMTDMWRSVIYCGSLGLGSDRTLLLYVKRNEQAEYELKSVGAQLRLYYSGAPVTLLDTNPSWIYVKKEKEIPCLLYTAPTDFGTALEKNLFSLMVSLSSGTRCQLEIGYETSKNTFSRSVKVGTGFDFDSLDFSDVGFSPMIKGRVKVGCIERKFDYIRIRLSSPAGRELAFDSVSAVFETSE